MSEKLILETLTTPQKVLLKLIREMGSGWHNTFDIVKKRHPGPKPQRFNRQVSNTLFNLHMKYKLNHQWTGRKYQWRLS